MGLWNALETEKVMMTSTDPTSEKPEQTRSRMLKTSSCATEFGALSISALGRHTTRGRREGYWYSSVLSILSRVCRGPASEDPPRVALPGGGGVREDVDLRYWLSGRDCVDTRHVLALAVMVRARGLCVIVSFRTLRRVSSALTGGGCWVSAL